MVSEPSFLGNSASMEPWFYNQIPSPLYLVPYYLHPHQYTPPPTPPSLFHYVLPPPPPSPRLYNPPFTLACHTTLSSGQPFYAVETITSMTPTAATSDVGTVVADSQLMVAHQVFDKSPETPTSNSDAAGDISHQLKDEIPEIIEKVGEGFADASRLIKEMPSNKVTQPSLTPTSVSVVDNLKDSGVDVIIESELDDGVGRSSVIREVEIEMTVEYVGSQLVLDWVPVLGGNAVLKGSGDACDGSEEFRRKGDSEIWGVLKEGDEDEGVAKEKGEVDDVENNDSDDENQKYDEDDKETDAVWEKIDNKLDLWMKDRRETRVKQEPQLVVATPPMFVESPEKVSLVKAHDTNSMFVLAEAKKKALKVYSPQQFLNNKVIIYKLHENEYGKIYDYMLSIGFEEKLYVRRSVIEMFVKCGRLDIVDRMIRSGYEKECCLAYGSVRHDVLDEYMSVLGVERLRIEEVQRIDWNSLDEKMKKWVQAIKIMTRVLLAGEKQLYDEDFSECELIREGYFIEMAKGCVMQLLNFGKAVVIAKWTPEKLFRILDMYDALAEVAPEMEGLFGDESGVFGQKNSEPKVQFSIMKFVRKGDGPCSAANISQVSVDNKRHNENNIALHGPEGGVALSGNAGVISGMAVASNTSREFLFWFRSHKEEAIKWGCAQHHPEDTYDGRMMHPRSSDIKVYNSYIRACVNAGKPKVAESLVTELETRDIKPTEEIYMALPRSFVQTCDIIGKQKIATTTQYAGDHPTKELCRLCVEACGQTGNPDQARHQFDHMLIMGHKTDDRCSASMIAGYETKNLLDKALDLLLQFEKEDLKLRIATYSVHDIICSRRYSLSLLQPSRLICIIRNVHTTIPALCVDDNGVLRVGFHGASRGWKDGPVKMIRAEEFKVGAWVSKEIMWESCYRIIVILLMAILEDKDVFKKERLSRIVLAGVFELDIQPYDSVLVIVPIFLLFYVSGSFCY